MLEVAEAEARGAGREGELLIGVGWGEDCSNLKLKLYLLPPAFQPVVGGVG